MIGFPVGQSARDRRTDYATRDAPKISASARPYLDHEKFSLFQVKVNVKKNSALVEMREREREKI